MVFHPADARDLVERMPWLTRLVLRCFGRRLNRDLFSPVLNRAYERRVISSQQLHELHRHFDPTQRGTVGRAVAPESPPDDCDCAATAPEGAHYKSCGRGR
jgi:hypothetical protein